MKWLSELHDGRAYESGPSPYDFLCKKGSIIEGTKSIDGVVCVGNEHKPAELLQTQADFEAHCEMCSKQISCKKKKDAIIKLFQSGKFQRESFSV